MAFIATLNGEKSKDYRSRLDAIRNPGMNHMSRTRSKIERFSKKENNDGTSRTARKKKKNYAGAYVAEPRRQKSSGFEINGGHVLIHLHDFVIDMDLTSLYPSIMILCNLSPKTFVGKFMLHDKFEIPMYPFIQFLDRDEKAEYKKNNANDFFMECYVGKHWWALMEYFFNIPEVNTILNNIEEHFEDFAA